MSSVLSFPPQLDASWAPRKTAVAMARSSGEVSLVHQLRYSVYVHEQGRRPDGIDRRRAEMEDVLDPCSSLWYAHDARGVVGTMTQTLIGPEFDLSQLPGALELHAFQREGALFGFSSRLAIAPEYRGTRVLSSLARHAYAHGRALGGKFDFIVMDPALVKLFERIGYVRYTHSIVDANGRDVGSLIPMVLPATDLEHLRRVRSTCWSVAERFAAEPKWSRLLRSHYPLINAYYAPDSVRDEVHSLTLARETQLPLPVARELRSMSFAHRVSAGAILRRAGDRITCSFLSLSGKLRARRTGVYESRARAADGVEFSKVEIRSVTDSLVLFMPDRAIARLQRRHPEAKHWLQELLQQSITGSVLR